MISGSSARTLSILEPHIQEGTQYRLCVRVADVPAKKLQQAGVPKPIKNGVSFLPAAVGKATKLNAIPRIEVDKTRGKVRVPKMIYGSWPDWHGTMHSGPKCVHYKQWPRIVHPPIEEELVVLKSGDDLFIASKICTFTEPHRDQNIHTLNLFLELFGGFQIFDENGRPLKAPKFERVNWELLPQGDFPWEKKGSTLNKFLAELPESDREIIKIRFNRIAKLKPDIQATGSGGFKGYMMFGFLSTDTYLLESTELDNATYVFQGDWKSLSKLTKKEILTHNLHKARIVHDRRWTLKVREAVRN